MLQSYPPATHLFPYVCCDCRRAFKRTGFGGTLPCPLCPKPAIWVHSRFKTPRAVDTEQWQKVRLLLDHGFRFVSIGGGVKYPATLKEARGWVKVNAHWATQRAT